MFGLMYSDGMTAFRHLDRSWHSRAEGLMRNTLTIDGRVSIQELLEHIGNLDPSITPADITISGHAVWIDQATVAEQIQQEKREAAAKQRTVDWERKKLRELIAAHPDEAAEILVERSSGARQ